MRRIRAVRACSSSRRQARRQRRVALHCLDGHAPRVARRSGRHRGGPNVPCELFRARRRGVAQRRGWAGGIGRRDACALRPGRQHHAAARVSGEHVHQDALRMRIRALDPDRLIVVDMGSRPGVILPACRRSSSITTTPRAACRERAARHQLRPRARGALQRARVRDLPRDRAHRIAGLGRRAGAVADLGTAAPFRELLGPRRAARRGRRRSRCSMQQARAGG